MRHFLQRRLSGAVLALALGMAAGALAAPLILAAGDGKLPAPSHSTAIVSAIAVAVVARSAQPELRATSPARPGSKLHPPPRADELSTSAKTCAIVSTETSGYSAPRGDPVAAGSPVSSTGDLERRRACYARPLFGWPAPRVTPRSG